jgi:hypothetical protein
MAWSGRKKSKGGEGGTKVTELQVSDIRCGVSLI